MACIETKLGQETEAHDKAKTIITKIKENGKRRRAVVLRQVKEERAQVANALESIVSHLRGEPNPAAELRALQMENTHLKSEMSRLKSLPVSLISYSLLVLLLTVCFIQARKHALRKGKKDGRTSEESTGKALMRWGELGCVPGVALNVRMPAEEEEEEDDLRSRLFDDDAF